MRGDYIGKKYKGVEVKGGRYLASDALLSHGSKLFDFEIRLLAGL